MADPVSVAIAAGKDNMIRFLVVFAGGFAFWLCSYRICAVLPSGWAPLDVTLAVIASFPMALGVVIGDILLDHREGRAAGRAARLDAEARVKSAEHDANNRVAESEVRVVAANNRVAESEARAAAAEARRDRFAADAALAREAYDRIVRENVRMRETAPAKTGHQWNGDDWVPVPKKESIE